MSSQRIAPVWRGKLPIIWCCGLVANIVQSSMINIIVMQRWIMLLCYCPFRFNLLLLLLYFPYQKSRIWNEHFHELHTVTTGLKMSTANIIGCWRHIYSVTFKTWLSLGRILAQMSSKSDVYLLHSQSQNLWEQMLLSSSGHNIMEQPVCLLCFCEISGLGYAAAMQLQYY